jgi:hypothetical protein
VFAGSNSAKGNGFLRMTKICSTPSFGGEVKLFAACFKILHHVKNLLKYERDTSQGKIYHFLRQFLLLIRLKESSGGQIRSSPLLISLHHGSPHS